MDEVVVVLLIIVGVVARIASVAKRGHDRIRQSPPADVSGDAPQTMTELLADMRTQLERARRKQQVEARTTLPSPMARSSRTRVAMATRPQRTDPVEVLSIRPAPVQVDHDAEAERLVSARFAAAEETAKGRRPEDHAAFDQRTRTSAPVAPAPRLHHVARLRQAVIWQEILGPPVSLRLPAE